MGAIDHPLWIAVGLTTVGLAAIALSIWHHRQRVARLTEWAADQGWSYQKSDRTLVHAFRGEPFDKGSSRKARHVLWGGFRGYEVIGFQYEYTVRNLHNHSRTYRYTVVAVEMPTSQPYLQVSHEHLGHRLMDLVGVRDLQLESEEFNRVFRIDTDDRKFAYDVLHPLMMEWLLDDERARSYPFRLDGDHAVCWMPGSLEPENVLFFADYLADILDRVPSYVWR